MKESHKSGRGWMFTLVGLLLIVVAAVLVLISLMNGKTTYVDSGGDGVVVTQSMVCEGTEIRYPFFIYDNADSRLLKINAVFNDDELETISLVYKLFYGDEELIKKSVVKNQVAMGESFIKSSLNVDALGVSYSALPDSAQMSLYARAKDITSAIAKYFLLGDLGGMTVNILTKTYNDEGLDCVITK